MSWRFCDRHPVEAVVVSGDLTQRAYFKQFCRCKQFLDALKQAYIVVPGNHDIPVFDRLYASYRNSLNTISSTGQIDHYNSDENQQEFLLDCLDDEGIQFKSE